MQQELALKAITHGTIGIAIITVLLVLLIGLRKELDTDAPLGGTVYLGIAVLGLCFPRAHGRHVLGKEARGAGKNFKPSGHRAVSYGLPEFWRGPMEDVTAAVYITLAVVAWLTGLWLLLAQVHG
jgi:hypothetical protein